MSISEGFAHFLAPRLPAGVSLEVYHASTQPILCSALYSPAPGQAEDKTWCESHFLALTQNGIPSLEDKKRPFVLGLEVLIFSTEHLTTVFVSKADTTGLLLRQSDLPRGLSIAFATVSAFLEFVIQPRLTGPRLVLSLFARSQNQYLFPGSIENTSKRILDDRQLVKWWCRVLDPILRCQHPEGSLGAEIAPKAYVVVPGCDKQETQSFFPSSARLDPISKAVWANRYPVELLGRDVSLPPRCLVPRLPDDPKTRFLDDLDGAQVNNDGTWRDVKSLDQFWELMSYRQECSAGRLVGFVWVVFDSNSSHTMPNAASVSAPASTSDGSVDTSRTTASISHPIQHSRRESNGRLNTFAQTTAAVAVAAEADVNSSSTLPPSQASGSDIGNACASVPGRLVTWPLSTRGQLTLSAESYSSLMDHLLQLDFAGEDTAAQSTREWITRAKDLATASTFGVSAVGSLDTSVLQSSTGPEAVVANILTAVRKKRKVDESPGTIVNTLSTNLVRKKPKSHD